MPFSTIRRAISANSFCNSGVPSGGAIFGYLCGFRFLYVSGFSRVKNLKWKAITIEIIFDGNQGARRGYAVDRVSLVKVQFDWRNSVVWDYQRENGQIES